MKVVGTFDPKVLYNQQNTAKRDTSFAAMLAFNLDRKPGEDDVTALFAANSSELNRLYEQTTGKKLDGRDESNTVVVTFASRVIPRSYWAGEFLDNSKEDSDNWLIPLRQIPSNQNMKYAVK